MAGLQLRAVHMEACCPEKESVRMITEPALMELIFAEGQMQKFLREFNFANVSKLQKKNQEIKFNEMKKQYSEN